jgi:hypothetical protein
MARFFKWVVDISGVKLEKSFRILGRGRLLYLRKRLRELLRFEMVTTLFHGGLANYNVFVKKISGGFGIA